MQRTSGRVRCGRFAVASFLAGLVLAAPALAVVPDCLVVQARAAPSGNGTYDHYLTFDNECDVRMFLAVRYSDATAADADSDVVEKGQSITIPLGFSQPNQAFRAHYDVRFGQAAEPRAKRKPPAATSGSIASRPKEAVRVARAVKPPKRDLPIAELCDRAVRNIFRLQGVPDTDGKLDERVANCPSRVERDPKKRRAELECLLVADSAENMRTCFVAK